jgi:hypothetical protein
LKVCGDMFHEYREGRSEAEKVFICSDPLC